MKKTASLFVLFAFLGPIFLSSGTNAQEVVESGGITIIRSEPINLWNRETWEWWASIKEVYLSWDNEFVNLSEISTWDVCGEWYRLITKEDWDSLWELVSSGVVEQQCPNLWWCRSYFNSILSRWNDFNLYSLDFIYTMKFGLFQHFDYIDARRLNVCEIWDNGPYCNYYRHMFITSDDRADFWIYYIPSINSFNKLGLSYNYEWSSWMYYIDNIEKIQKYEPLLCIWEEVPELTSEITFVNEENGFKYKTEIWWWGRLSQSVIDYINQNNEWYVWFSDVNMIDLENEEFKYNTILYGYKPISKENITYKWPYNIENRKNNEIIVTIKEISIDTDKELNMLNLFATDDICGTWFHFFRADRSYWEGNENWETDPLIWQKVPLSKLDLFLDNINNYSYKLVNNFPNYSYALGFLLLMNVESSISFWEFDIMWEIRKNFSIAEPSSENSADIKNYVNPRRNFFADISVSNEHDAETWEYRIVVWEEVNSPDGTFWSDWKDFLCVSDEVMQLESEVVFINEDNNFEYRTRMSSWGKVSQEDLDYINEENSDYLWYVADVVDIDIENEGFDYNTVVTARKPVEIKDTEKGEVVKLKSVQNSPYFADDFDEYEDEVTWFYDREDVCGQKYHIITWEELTDLIMSWNLSEDEYNWWGDNTLTYCVSDPYVIVTFKNEDSQSEYEIYVEKWNTLKSWDINKITKNNTWYEWYDGDILINLTWTVFNNKVTLYASKIKESDNNQSHSSGWGWWGGWSSKSDTDKKTETQTWSQNNSDVETQDNQKNTDTQTDWNISDKGWESQNNTQQWQQYSEEFQQAYKFAKWNWITTMPTIQDAKMNQKLTRIQMAKMLSQYAINVLWKTPDTTKSIKFKDVTEKMNSDYDNWVSLAYQLWIMWINMKNNKFRPNDEVTRGEFATALSRLLYNTQDWTWKAKYYEPHIAKLLNEWIITNPDPRMKELRGYVMIMLMRSEN